jgi:crotonobetainyl-CoA:carnitine CoA-transferase CaiB-like acyl-CoA transferase
MPPLQGLRVVDLTRVLAGPFCTMMLADMGAEVIKIEEPTSGDDTRAWAPFIEGWSSYYLGVNRGKKSLCLNLRSREGAESLKRLIDTADVLVENFRPGSLAQLGFGYSELAKLNTRLIYCSITAFGQTGPRAGEPGYDVVIQGESGLMEVTGFPEGEPTRVGIAVTDYLAGQYALQGILLALIERQSSGKGQFVDIALFDSMLSVMRLPFGILLATGAGPGRVGNDHPSIAPYEALRAKDGLIIVAVANPRLWAQFCEAIGCQALQDDARFRSNDDRLHHRQALKEQLEHVFESLTVEDLIGRLKARGVPCGRVRSIQEAIADPQVAARRMVVFQSLGTAGSVATIGDPVKLSRTPSAIGLPPPRLGEHTQEILAGLGLSADEITAASRPFDAHVAGCARDLEVVAQSSGRGPTHDV